VSHGNACLRSCARARNDRWYDAFNRRDLGTLLGFRDLEVGFSTRFIELEVIPSTTVTMASASGEKTCSPSSRT
jgi:hypothetical protein